MQLKKMFEGRRQMGWLPGRAPAAFSPWLRASEAQEAQATPHTSEIPGDGPQVVAEIGSRRHEADLHLGEWSAVGHFSAFSNVSLHSKPRIHFSVSRSLLTC